MSNNLKAVSAFSVYSAKRKSEQPLKSKKRKPEHILQKITTSNHNNVKQKINNQIMERQDIKNKYTLNVAVKTKHGNVTKKGNLKVFKNNILNDKGYIMFLKQLNKKNKLKKINNTQKCVYNELKLKAAIKNKKNSFSKRKTTEPQNIEKQNDDNTHLNNTNNGKNVKYFGNSNPIVNSEELFKWLIYPCEMEAFFK